MNGSQTIQGLAYGTSAALIGAVTLLNGAHVFTQTQPAGVMQAGALATVAALAGIAGPVALHSMFDLPTRGTKAVSGVVSVAALTICLLVNVSATATGKSDTSARRVAVTGNAQTHHRDRARIEAELAPLAGVRPAAEVRALIDGVRVTPRIWQASAQCTDPTALKGKSTADACKPVIALRGELARAERKTVLEEQLAELPAGEAAIASDPAGEQLAWIASHAGMKVAPADASRWSTLLWSLASELLAAFMLALAGALRSCDMATRVQRSAEHAPGVHRGVQSGDRSSGVKPGQTSVREELNARIDQALNAGSDDMKTHGKRVIDLLQSSGGRITTTQRALAACLMLSLGTVNGVLHELRDAGVVELATSASGTTLALIG